MYILCPLIVQWDSSILVDGVARNSLHAATNCVTEPAVEEFIVIMFTMFF